MTQNDQKTLLDYALVLLGNREHSCLELQNKLSTRSEDPLLITKVIEELICKGYQSDQRFTESYIRSRVRKGYGEVRLTLELRKKGINNELIKQTLLAADVDWFEVARQVKEKKFGPAYEISFAKRAKQQRFLQYRGFNFDQIHFAVSKQTDEDWTSTK